MRSCSPPQALALAALLLAVNWGCAPKTDRPETLPVSGKVTYKGQPVTKGTITFQSDGGQAATGEIQSDGTYRLSTFADRDGALPGHHKVMIIANDADPTLMPGSSPGYKPPKDLVPKKYAKLETSGLTADVSKDKTTFEFELK
jgi:hypothetical protein